ncbi:ribonuclease T2 [Basidiobolus meristosporus CBS 931.73]|uniref:ribonuclease T2 n=1 Tax=Basidiobolus meristosporus CBS 931.73 TaxID=1314790 RepID=A0A1Y1XV72_9FUNG|nr:ribonuclease T2 [Basidiobolus meristosporus CBS 931.73]|eukprot:ORX89174.1 ribonuclease T2 [Basidiobolus meristosporus CBS 931.73]
MKLSTRAFVWHLVGLASAYSPSCPVDELSCALPSANDTADACCSPKYGLVVFTQQWLTKQGPEDAFTIHGLWPNACNGSFAPEQGCDPARQYSNVGEIVQQRNTSLYELMNEYWVSYTGDNSEFWTHEWDKHGTCVSTLSPSCYGGDYQPYEEMLDYFDSVIQLHQQYDIYTALSGAGISPGGEYSKLDMVKAVKSSLGVDAWFHCKKDALDEAWIYFNVQGRNRYVPAQQYRGEAECPDQIQYPAKQTMGQGNE